MPKASDLFPIDDFYVSDAIHDTAYFRSRSVHELAEGQCTLEGVKEDEKLDLVKAYNKTTKVRPPSITKGFKRPKFSDMDIALIQASYTTVPLSTLAHLLGTTENHVKATYKETNKYHIPLFPLISVVDTSRYIEPNIERVIYNSDELNHVDDPRTYKELLRLNVTEYRHDADILKRFTSKNIDPLDIERTLSRLALRVFISENVQEEYFGFYGKSWSENHRGVLTGGIPTREITPYFSYYKSRNKKMKYLYHFTQHPVKYNHELLKALNPPSNLSNKQLVALSVMLNCTPNYIHTLHPTMENYPYTTDITKFSNYRPNKENRFYLPYLVARPKLYERALGSPILDNNMKLRYAMYNVKRLKHEVISYKEDTYYFGIRCLKCNVFLTPHTVSSCPHMKLKSTLLSKRTFTPPNVKQKQVTLHLNKIKDDRLLNIITNHFNLTSFGSTDATQARSGSTPNLNTFDGTKIKSPHTYSYGRNLTRTSGKTPSYTSYNRHQYRFNTKTYQHLEVFTSDTINALTDFTLHYYKYSTKVKTVKPNTLGLYDISTYNVYELYTQFHTILQSTTQEPTIL